jgi:hypothetical protein
MYLFRLNATLPPCISSGLTQLSLPVSLQASRNAPSLFLFRHPTALLPCFLHWRAFYIICSPHLLVAHCNFYTHITSITTSSNFTVYVFLWAELLESNVLLC